MTHTLPCVLIALAASHNLEMHQINIKAAFLNENIEEEICMEHQKGIVTLRHKN